PPVPEPLEPVLPEWRPAEIAAELRKPVAVPGGDVHGRVEIERKSASSRTYEERATGVDPATSSSGIRPGAYARVQPTGLPSAARSIAATSIRFMVSIARMARSALAVSRSVIKASRRVGTICQDRPNLSFTQPHCSASGTAESAAVNRSTSP